MPRKKYFNEDIGTRIHSAFLKIVEEGKYDTYQEIAEALGVKRETIHSWVRNEVDKRSVPDLEYIIKICELTGVSTDYILGISKIKTIDTSIKGAVNTTRLSEEAIQKIGAPADETTSRILSAIIEHEKYFDMVHYLFMACVCGYENETEKNFSFKDDKLTLTDALGYEFFIEMASKIFRDIASDSMKGLTQIED